MSRTSRKDRPQEAFPALAYARRIGTMLACVASVLGPPGWVKAGDDRGTRVARAAPSHDGSAHAMPPGLPEPAPARTPSPAPPPPAAPVATWALCDFERM